MARKQYLEKLQRMRDESNKLIDQHLDRIQEAVSGFLNSNPIFKARVYPPTFLRNQTPDISVWFWIPGEQFPKRRAAYMGTEGVCVKIRANELRVIAEFVAQTAPPLRTRRDMETDSEDYPGHVLRYQFYF